MKEKTVKTKDKDSGIDMLARLMKQGFDRMDDGFAQGDKRFEKVEGRLGSLKEDMSHIKKEVVALNLAQDETNRRLTSIERKQTGILSSLDETVIRSEFALLANKVAMLEKKR